MTCDGIDRGRCTCIVSRDAAYDTISQHWSSHWPMIRFRLSIIMLNMADSSSARFSLTVSLTTPFFMSIMIARAETIWTMDKKGNVRTISPDRRRVLKISRAICHCILPLHCCSTTNDASQSSTGNGRRRATDSPTMTCYVRAHARHMWRVNIWHFNGNRCDGSAILALHFVGDATIPASVLAADGRSKFEFSEEQNIALHRNYAKRYRE